MRRYTSSLVNVEIQAVQGTAKERTRKYVTEPRQRNATYIHVYTLKAFDADLRPMPIIRTRNEQLVVDTVFQFFYVRN